MSGGGTQKSLRKALGAIKDTTTVGIAKVNSDYKVCQVYFYTLAGNIGSTGHFLIFLLLAFGFIKELDIAIVKATNHVERPAKEKHIKGGSVFSHPLYVFLSYRLHIIVSASLRLISLCVSEHVDFMICLANGILFFLFF